VVAGSNPAAPTNLFNDLRQSIPRQIRVCNQGVTNPRE
jgi:hypothetical protein